jgi:xylulokinase
LVDLVAGIDVSTQGTKAVIVDPDLGQVVATGTAPHTVEGVGGARETHPDVWWTALQEALAATGWAADVRAISVAGQQHGLVVTDGHQRPLRPAILWNDTRSAPQARSLRARFDPSWWAQHAAGPPVASFTVTSWAWLRQHEPHIVADARAVRLPHDHITERLCGAPVTDRGDASGTGWWSPSRSRYLDEVLELPEVELAHDLLPTVAAPDGAVGETGAAGRLLGLEPGTLVGPGTGDNMAAALGLGVAPGCPVISLGTSGTVYAVAEESIADTSGVLAGFADASGRFLPLACTLNCTLAVDRMAAWLSLDREDVADESGGVVVLPFLDGERTPNLPGSTGSLHGLTHTTTRQQLLLATYEGAVASLAAGLQSLEGHVPAVAASSELLLIGGGSRGRAWPRTVGRLMGRRVVVPEPAEYVALGAAAQAAAALQGGTATDIAQRWAAQRPTWTEEHDLDVAVRERISATLHDAYPQLGGAT